MTSMTVLMVVMKSVTGNSFVHMTELIDVLTVDSALQKIEYVMDIVTVLMEKMKVSLNVVPMIHIYQITIGTRIIIAMTQGGHKCIRSNKKMSFIIALD